MSKSFGPTTRVSRQQHDFFEFVRDEVRLPSRESTDLVSLVLSIGKARSASGSSDLAMEAVATAARLESRASGGESGGVLAARDQLVVTSLLSLVEEMPWRAAHAAVVVGLWHARGNRSMAQAVVSELAVRLDKAREAGSARQVSSLVSFFTALAMPSVGVLSAVDAGNQLKSWAAEARSAQSATACEAVLQALLWFGDSVDRALPGCVRECLELARQIQPKRIIRECAAIPGRFVSTLDRACSALEHAVTSGWNVAAQQRPDRDPRVAVDLGAEVECVSWPPAGVAVVPLCAASSVIDSVSSSSSARDISLLSADLGEESPAEPDRDIFPCLATPLLAPAAGVGSLRALSAVGLASSGSGSSEDGELLCDEASAYLVQRWVLDCALFFYPLHEEAALEIAQFPLPFPVGPLAVDALICAYIQVPRASLPPGYLALLLKQLERADARGFGCSLVSSAQAEEEDADDEGEAAEAAIVVAASAEPYALRLSDAIATCGRLVFKHAARIQPWALARFADLVAVHSSASGWHWLWDEWASVLGSSGGGDGAQRALVRVALDRTMLLMGDTNWRDCVASAMQPGTQDALNRLGIPVRVPLARAPDGRDPLVGTEPTELAADAPPTTGLEPAKAAMDRAHATGDLAGAFAALLPQVAGRREGRELASESPVVQEALARAVVFVGRQRLADVSTLVSGASDALQLGTAQGRARLAKAVMDTWQESGPMCELMFCRLVADGMVEPAEALHALYNAARGELWVLLAVSAVLRLALSRRREARDALLRFLYLIPGVAPHEGGLDVAPVDEVRLGPAEADEPPLVGRAQPLEALREAHEAAERQWDACVALLGRSVGEALERGEADSFGARVALSSLHECLSLPGDGTFAQQARGFSPAFSEHNVRVVGGDERVGRVARLMVEDLSTWKWGDARGRLVRDAHTPLM
jgi:hypothetical protein